MKFTVDRQTWLRGEGSYASYLLRSDGKKCCVGFYAMALGFTEDQILGRRGPVNVSEWPIDWMKRGGDTVDAHSPDAMAIFELNDDEVREHGVRSEEARERRIREAFAKHGVEVEFVGEP